MLIPFEQLLRKYRISPTGIIHVGAHHGEEAAAYAKAGVANVIWVEADPTAYHILGENIKRYPRNLRLRACVGDVDGKEVVFNVANNEGQSSSYLEFGTHKEVHKEVEFIATIPMRTARLDSLLIYNAIDVSNYDFVNMDLQGAELLALRGMGKLLKKVKYLYLEVNKAELYKGCPLVEEIQEYIAQFGFVTKEIAWTGFMWGDLFAVKEK